MNKKYFIWSLYGSLAIAGAVVFISWRQKAANVAAAFIDQTEIGNNAGFADDVFEQMMKTVGWKGGEAWCMFFAKSVYLQAFPKRAAELSRYLTGSTQLTWATAKAHPEIFKVITSGKPRVGDIIIWQSVSNPSLGHAGIVKKKGAGDNYETIEGNTSLQGARDGQGVTKQERRLVPGTVDGSLKLLGFIRLKL